MTKKDRTLPPDVRYSLIDKDMTIVGGVYTSPDEAMKWAKKAPRNAPPLELVAIDPDAPESEANPRSQTEIQ